MTYLLEALLETNGTLNLRNNWTSTLAEAVNGTKFCIFSACFRLPLVALWAVEWLISPFLLYALIQVLWRVYNDEAKDRSSNLPLPPGEYGIPFFGETVSFFRHRSTFYEERRRHYGNVFKTHLLGQPTIRLIGSAVLEGVIRQESRLVDVVWPKSVRILIGSRALSSFKDAEFHTKCKRDLSKVFSTDALQLYLPQSLEVMRSHLRSWCRQGEVSVYPACQLLVSANTARIFLGLGDKSRGLAVETATAAKFDLTSWHQAQQTFTNNVFSLPIQLPFGLSGLSRGMRARNYLVKEIDAALDRVRGGENETCALSLLDSAGCLSDNDLQDNMIELLFAGYDTLSSATCTIVMEMGQRPEVVTRVRQELQDRNFLDSSRTLEVEELKRLPYVTGVVKECLRLTPPVGGVFRRAKQTFEVNGYQIPAGWMVVYAIRGTHEQSPLFDTDFRPERWTDLTESGTRTRFHYLPFSMGGHACLGREFAMLFLRAWVVELVRCTSWRLLSTTLPPEMEVLPSPRPKDGLPALFTLASSSSDLSDNGDNKKATSLEASSNL